MKKQFLNLGKVLNKAEQKQINGGNALYSKSECEALGETGRWVYFDCSNTCVDTWRNFIYPEC